MRFTKTDDPIKGIGFVTIYFANLEDELDDLVKLSGHLFKLPPKIGRWTFRDKAEWLQKQFCAAYADYSYEWSDQESAHVDLVLVACRRAALKRNEILHRPIFGDMKGGALQKTVSGNMRRLDVTEIYRFAEYIHKLGGEVYGLSFSLGRLQVARSNNNPTTQLAELPPP